MEKWRQEISEIRKSHQDQLTIVEKRNHQAMMELRDRLEAEKEIFQDNFLKKSEEKCRIREKAFRDQIIQERDSEIEVVIERLERETGSSNSDATRRYRMDIERIKTETAAEMKEVYSGRNSYVYFFLAQRPA
jgi:hypothetical protein